VQGLSGGRTSDISFDVAEGEIVGLAGLDGSGAEELPYLLYGALPASAGEMFLGGRRMDLPDLTPMRAIAAGLVLVPAERRTQGIILSMTLAENVCLPLLKRLRVGPLLSGVAVMRESRRLIDLLGIVPRDPRIQAGMLSGGNQQKAVLAKWITTDAPVLLLHEPTQGVDVGARAEIMRYLRRVSGAGKGIICASSDFGQLADICDRVMIMHEGRITRTLVGAEVNKSLITEMCLTDVETR
jgi:ribose transport system ATP-binding protein